MVDPVANLDEIRALLSQLPGPDLAAGTAAAARQAQLTKPAGSLGRLEELAIWLATWQARHPPRLDHPRTLVFAGNHGVAARGVSAYPASVTAQMVQNFIAGGAAVNQLCRVFDAGLKVYEMNLDRPTGDIVVEPAMSEEECAKAMAYGMMAVEPGIDALAVGEMGIGNTTAAAALCAGVCGGAAALCTGPGPGVAGPSLEAKRAVVAEAVARHRPAARDPFDMLRRLGGLEFAALAGAVMAARGGEARPVAGAARRFRLARRGGGPLRRRPPRARPLRRGAPVGRAGPSAPRRGNRPAPALRLRHEARRSLGRVRRLWGPEGGGRLPYRDGHLRRSRRQWAELADRSSE